MPDAVARQYAEALLDVVCEAGSGINPEEALDQLRQLAQLVGELRELRLIFNNPAVSAQDKSDLVERIAELLGLAPVIRNFLGLTVRKRRVNLLPQMVEAYQELLDERLGIVRPRVTTAVELSPAERHQMETALARLTGKQVRCEFSVDPELLGGVVVQIDSTVYDGSIRGHLEALRQRLTE